MFFVLVLTFSLTLSRSWYYCIFALFHAFFLIRKNKKGTLLMYSFFLFVGWCGWWNPSAIWYMYPWIMPACAFVQTCVFEIEWWFGLQPGFRACVGKASNGIFYLLSWFKVALTVSLKICNHLFILCKVNESCWVAEKPV